MTVTATSWWTIFWDTVCTRWIPGGIL